MPKVYVIIGAASQNHMHMSSSENNRCFQNATCCPNALKSCIGGLFQHAEFNCSQQWASDKILSKYAIDKDIVPA